MCAVDGSNEVTLPMVYTREDLHLSGSNIAQHDEVKSFEHLKDIIMPDVDLREIKLSIGQDASDILLPREVCHGKPGEPYATRT